VLLAERRPTVTQRSIAIEITRMAMGVCAPPGRKLWKVLKSRESCQLCHTDWQRVKAHSDALLTRCLPDRSFGGVNLG
jgi:hypothetical protein